MRVWSLQITVAKEKGKKMLIKLFLIVLCIAFSIIALSGALYIGVQCLDLVKDIIDEWGP